MSWAEVCRTALKFQPLLETTFPNYMQEIRGELFVLSLTYLYQHVGLVWLAPLLHRFQVLLCTLSLFFFFCCRLLTLS